MENETLMGIQIPNALKGPLGSHLNYLTHIALPNCVDYFELVQQQKEEARDSESNRYMRLRFFLNAIESLNNAPEFFFHENKQQQGWADKQRNSIIGGIRRKHEILKTIAEIANAYKHCITRNEMGMNASDLQTPSLSINIALSAQTVKVEYDFDSIESEDTLGEAFRFWMDYLNHPDDRLLPEPEIKDAR